MFSPKWFVLILIFGGITAQAQSKADAGGYVVLPPDIIVLAVAAQPDAPVRIEEPQLFKNTESGALEIAYSVRSVTTKAIRYVTPVMWTSYGTGGTLDPHPTTGVLEPGEVIKSGAPTRIVALTPELRQRLDLNGPVKGVLVVMIERVTFADGTVWSDVDSSNALLHYFEGVSDKLERFENLQRGTKPAVLKP